MTRIVLTNFLPAAEGHWEPGHQGFNIGLAGFGLNIGYSADWAWRGADPPADVEIINGNSLDTTPIILYDNDHQLFCLMTLTQVIRSGVLAPPNPVIPIVRVASAINHADDYQLGQLYTGEMTIRAEDVIEGSSPQAAGKCWKDIAELNRTINQDYKDACMSVHERISKEGIKEPTPFADPAWTTARARRIRTGAIINNMYYEGGRKAKHILIGTYLDTLDRGKEAKLGKIEITDKLQSCWLKAFAGTPMRVVIKGGVLGAKIHTFGIQNYTGSMWMTRPGMMAAFDGARVDRRERQVSTDRWHLYRTKEFWDAAGNNKVDRWHVCMKREGWTSRIMHLPLPTHVVNMTSTWTPLNARQHMGDFCSFWSEPSVFCGSREETLETGGNTISLHCGDEVKEFNSNISLPENSRRIFLRSLFRDHYMHQTLNS
jgi:hypothetical protein